MSRATRKRRTRGHVIADLSVNHVERHVLLAGNTLERYVHDYGLDLEMWTFDGNGEVESGFVSFQVKATDTLRTVENGRFVTVRIDRRDYRFWLAQTGPVVLVLYDATEDVGYWIEIHDHRFELDAIQYHRVQRIHHRAYSEHPTIYGECRQRDHETEGIAVMQNDPYLRSRYSDLTLGDFDRVLRELGFELTPTSKPLRRYIHHTSDTVVDLPAGNDEDLVPKLYIRGHGKVLDWRGIVSQDRFEEMLASQKVA